MNKKLVLDLATHLGYAFIEDNKIVGSGNIDLSKEKKNIQYISSTKRKTLPKYFYTTSDHSGSYIEGIERYDAIAYQKSKDQGDDEIGDGDIDEIPSDFIDGDSREYGFNVEDEHGYEIKGKSIVKKLTIKEQLKRLKEFIEFEKSKGYDIVMEQPTQNTGGYSTTIKTISKLYMLYGIVNLVCDEIEEVNVSTGFNGIKKEYAPFTIGEEKERKKCISGDSDEEDAECIDGKVDTIRKIKRKETSLMVANQLVNGEVKDDNEADAICLAQYIIHKGEKDE